MNSRKSLAPKQRKPFIKHNYTQSCQIQYCSLSFRRSTHFHHSTHSSPTPLSWTNNYRITSLSIEGIPKHSQLEVPLSLLSSIFINKTINRQVNSDFQKLIVKHLIHNKKAEFINPKKPELGVYIYWRSLVDWGDLLYQYVDDTGQKGTVLTIYELTKSEETTVPQDLHNLDETFLVKIIKDYLIKQGKAQLLIDENNEIGGVKIV